MPVNEDEKYKQAALWFRRNPDMSMCQAMRAAGFSDAEATNETFQRRVRRRQEYNQENVNQVFEVSTVPGRMDVQDDGISALTCTPVTKNSTSEPSNATPTTPVSQATNKKKDAPLSIRSTSSQKMKQIINKRKLAKKTSAAMKEATTKLAREWGKKNASNPMSPQIGARKVTAAVNRKHGTNLAFRTVTRYTKNGLIGVSPLKKGPEGLVPDRIVKVLVRAFESFVRINQGNGNGSAIERKNLVRVVNQVTAPLFVEPKYNDKLYERLLLISGVDFNSEIQMKDEDRRHRWTTYANLRLWFETWGEDLVELGFAYRDANDKIIIPPEQLCRILNLDESCLSLDGSKSRRGGRPSSSIIDPSLPHPGKIASKSSVTLTFIGGSTAGAEALPPHLQFSSSAKTEDRQQIRFNVGDHLQRIHGTWGLNSPAYMPVGLGVNDKGGMDEVEFDKYIRNTIVPLYIDTVADEPGKRVIIKVDSGPGRLNLDMLGRLRLMGFYVYPGVPNTTSVSQETDQNYGCFKTIYRTNLDKLIQDRHEHGKKTSVGLPYVGLLIFGGEDPETGCQYQSAFKAGFSKEKCQEAWDKVGAAPLTMKCLESPKVRHERGVEDDPLATMYDAMQADNDAAVHWLNLHGLKGNLLAAKVDTKVASAIPLTSKGSKERQQQLKNASSAGQRFEILRGSHISGDDLQIAKILASNAIELENMERVKKERIDKKHRDTEARKLLDVPPAQLNGNQLKLLLLWQGIANKNQPKHVAGKREKWIQVKDREPPAFDEWTAEDQAKMEKLRSTDIDIEDTAIGRAKKTVSKEFSLLFDKMSPEAQLEHIEEFERRRTNALGLSSTETAQI